MGLASNLSSWWRKRQREKKRLKLLALVRKVREEQGDYDAYSKARAKKVDTSKRLQGERKGRKASSRL
jgi:hypothetical protein